MTPAKPCEAWAERLAARHVEDLSSAEHAALDAHIASCPACAAVHHDYNLLTTRIRALPAVKPLAQGTSEFQWLHTQPRYSALERAMNAWQAFIPTPQGSLTRKIRAGTVALATVSIITVLLTLFLGFNTLFLRLNHSSQESASRRLERKEFRLERQGITNFSDTAVALSASFSACLLPTNRNNAVCQGVYKGTISDGTFHVPSAMLLSIKQQQETVSGSCTLSQPLAGNWRITSGSISPKGDVQFTISVYNLTIHFTGKVHPDGSISGTYTTSAHQTGTWSVSWSGS